ncbi:MAG TPA: VanZ family protein [Anaerolineales bacterium]
MKWLAAGLGALIITIVALADTRHLGFLGWLYDFPYGDKVGHFLLFGLLSVTVNLAVLERPQVQEPWHVALKASIVLALLIGLEEFSQGWFPGRTSSWTDLAASYLGVGVFAWAALKFAARRGAKAAGNHA